MVEGIAARGLAEDVTRALHRCTVLKAENARLVAKIVELRAVVEPFANRAGGERPGDTLLRVAEKITVRGRERGVENEDWREQLRDFSQLMNAAADAAGKKGE